MRNFPITAVIPSLFGRPMLLSLAFRAARLSAENMCRDSFPCDASQPPAIAFMTRLGLRVCLSEFTGYLLSQEQLRHFFTNVSAHGFLPPLLLFSTSVAHVLPSTSSVSHRLHIVCFIAGERRICIFSETSRKSDTIFLGRACAYWESDTSGACGLLSSLESSALLF